MGTDGQRRRRDRMRRHRSCPAACALQRARYDALVFCTQLESAPRIARGVTRTRHASCLLHNTLRPQNPC